MLSKQSRQLMISRGKGFPARRKPEGPWVRVQEKPNPGNGDVFGDQNARGGKVTASSFRDAGDRHGKFSVSWALTAAGAGDAGELFACPAGADLRWW